ncbi:NAD(P)/FAD-dependent oxidoreductase [Sulfurimonas sp. SAG-AH-194-C21]|nr:FAD/NAD(P)-binding oxidoreductase [Sulfurimonas sp. SAG-AH-194-C21]MDF1882642.1 NAD(P)/FAD-dependent oxidoreductase [Sulfurimonas sp. SAG-AH-194-C21]
MQTKNILSRRNAIKLASLSIVTASALSANWGEAPKKSVTKKKILIVGGGSSAIIILSTLLKSIQNPDITIIAPNEIHLYQPGQLYVATGIFDNDEITRDNADFIPKSVTWIKEKVEKFLPEQNAVITDNDKKVSYDYLIVATGTQYRYEYIKGLTQEDIGTNNLASVYINDTDKGTAEGGPLTWKWLNEIKEASKERKQTVLFVKASGMLKCGATAQKIMYMSADYLKKNGFSANYIYSTTSSRLFGSKVVSGALEKAQEKYDTIKNLYKHNIIAIDVKNKIATYEYKYQIKEGWDPDFKEWESIEDKRDIIEVKYDFLHLVPHMSAPDALVNSPLCKKEGMFKDWLEVDEETLQHIKYENVFGIGDVCGTPLGKTIPSAQHQAKIVLKNLQSVINKKELQAKFDGHSVCPIKVGFGEVVMVEFNYSGLNPSISYLDASKPSWLWWIYDVYAAKPLYWNGVLPARI